MQRRLNRRPEIAAMNVLLCLMVIFIHVSSAPVTTYNHSSIQFAAVFIPWRFSSFVVQGFIFLSGLRLFLTKSGGVDYGKFYLGRLTRIIIPYFAWNVIFYLFFIMKGYFPFSVKDLGLYILKGDLVSPFYFIVAIVQFYALTPLWFKLVRKVNITAALLIAAAISFVLGQFLPNLISMAFPGAAFQYNDRLLTTYLFYWVAGCFVGANYDRALDWLYEKRRLLLIAFILTGFADITLSYLSFTGARRFVWLDNIHFFYCVTAVFFFFTLFIGRYRRRDITSRLAKRIDGAAYTIFLSHCFVLFLANDVMHLLGIVSVTLSYIIRIVAVYSMTLTLCILWNQVTGRLKHRSLVSVLH